MNAGAKLAAYGVVLGLAFGGGAAIGGMVGPIDAADPTAHNQGTDVPRPADGPPAATPIGHGDHVTPEENQ